MIRRPPESTLFPYPPLFRSLRVPTPAGGVAVNGTALPDLPAGMVQLLSGGRRTGTQPIQGGLVAHHRRSEEHTSELQSRQYLVCRRLLEKKTNPPYSCEPLG